MNKHTLHLFTAVEIAEELTLRDAELLRRIGATEIRNGAWMHKEKKQELAPNVLAMVEAFNSLAHLVAKEILAEESLGKRAEVIATYIKVAKKCYALRNYNSLNAVLAGLMCTPVHRLKKTWKEVPSKRKRQLDYLSNLMSEERNWRQYRRQLAKHVSNNTSCVIFLGVLLSNVVRYESYQQLKRSNRLSSAMPVARKVSVCETFTVLEAITVRNRLRNMSRREVGGGRGGEVKCFAVEEEGEKACVCEEQSTLHGDIMTEKISILSLSDGDSNGDISPDVPDLDDWSVDVCREADRRLGNRKFSQWQKPRLLIRRGRSLEQLLKACQVDDDDDFDDRMAPSLSRSLPRLSPVTSYDQVWDDDKSSSPSKSSPTLPQRSSFDIIDDKTQLSVEYQSSNGVHNDDEISRIGSATTLSSEQSDYDNDAPNVHVKRSQIVHEAESPSHKNSDSAPEISDVESSRKITRCSLGGSSLRKGGHSTENGMNGFQSEQSESTCNGKRQFPTDPATHRQLRKRYTASDELDVIQLQTAREDPNSDPTSLLKLYQFLSLGYSVRYTSSPYIREILSDCKTTSEAQNYRRSYILECL